MIARYDTNAKVEKAFGELKDYWEKQLSVITLDHPDPRLSRMVNIWNPYQCMVTYNMSRSASYFESGIGRGMGFRDSNQDLVGYVHMIAPTVKGKNHRYRLHPARRRQRLSPVPAADKERQCRDRRQLQR